MKALETVCVFALVASIGATALAQDREASESVDERNQQTLDGLADGTADRDIEWKHIVIHHTASEWTSLERVDAFHRRKFDDPDGIQYHFLIGNGKKAAAGLIEVGRWKLQKRAIHLFKPSGAPDAVAISLVGNLHEREIRPPQYEALLGLVVRLARDHAIPVDRITTHTRVDGRLTVCPGKHFPYERFIEDVRARLDEE